MIAYFDTSAVVPLVVQEPSTARCEEHWELADRMVSVRLLTVEARAALAQATRAGRLTVSQLRQAGASLRTLLSQIDFMELDEALATRAGDLAEAHGLRAYDAVHLGAAVELGDDDVLFVTGDHALAEAALAAGLDVARTT